MKTTIRLGTAADTERAARVLLTAYNMADHGRSASGLPARNRGWATGTWWPRRRVRLSALAPGTCTAFPTMGLAELDRIAVLPKYRMNGAGSELFHSLVADAQHFYAQRGERLRKLFLMTHDDNHAAHALYRKVGMEKEVVLKDHYYDGRAEAVFSIFFPRSGVVGVDWT